MIGQQRRQISRMIWVHCPAGIKMAAGIGKALPVTVFSLMDVKGKEACLRPGKPHHLCLNQDTIASLKESHNSPQARMIAVPPNLSNGPSKKVGILLLLVSLKMCKKHPIPSFFFSM